MEGSCECTKQAVVDSRQGSSPALGLREELTISYRKKTACYEMLNRDSELGGSCEHGNEPSSSIKGREFLD